MNKFVALIFAAVILGMGATLLPPVKIATTAIFDSFPSNASMPPFLALIVSAWPIWILLAFVVGALFLVKRA